MLVYLRKSEFGRLTAKPERLNLELCAKFDQELLMAKKIQDDIELHNELGDIYLISAETLK
jgi:hypothetical protein